MLIQANTQGGYVALVDVLHLESCWSESVEPNEWGSEGFESYFAMGSSGERYHLSRSTYEKLVAHWKDNAGLL